MKKIRYLALTVIIFAATLALPAQAHDWLWVSHPEGYTHESGQGVATDAAGNTYVTGGFSYSISFGAITLVTAGNYDIFVAKLGPDQNWLWAVRAGGTGDDGGSGIGVDASGNVYVCGSYHDQASFGSFQLTGMGLCDAFAAKLDSEGNWLWASSGVSPGYDAASAIAVDPAGNCLVAGCFQELAVFDDLTLVSQGERDIFCGKLDSSGNWLWACRAGGIEDDVAHGFALDAGGNSYVCGNFQATADFGTAALTSMGGYDIFAAKLDPEGNWLWAVRAGGPDTSNFIPDVARGIATDPAGNVLFAGTFMGFGNFGPTNLVTGGDLNADIFVAKLDGDGNWLWVAQGQGTSTDVAYCLATDASGNAWLSGLFYETLSFFGVGSITSAGSTDIFLAGVDLSGEWFCARRAGGIHIDRGFGICCDAGGNPLLTGSFMATADFGNTSLTSVSGEDVFVARFGCQSANGEEVADHVPPCTLAGIRPNPSSSAVSIEIEVSAGRHPLQLCVFDLRGRKVGTAFSGVLDGGRHNISWNWDPLLPPGVYILRLTDGSVTRTARLARL
jgi:hypothetical protein